LEDTVRRDPDHAEAWARLSHAYVEEEAEGFNREPGSLDRALEAAQRAVQLDPTSAWARFAVARAHFHRHDLDLFFPEAEQAIALNPNDGDVLASIGLYIAYGGDWESGMPLMEKAMALSPFFPGWYYFPFGDNYYRKGKYDEALAMYEKVNMPGFYVVPMSLAWTYGQLGRKEEGQAAVAKLLQLRPDFAQKARDEISKYFWADQDLIEHFVDGLRKAGLDIRDKPTAAY
jgi:tetratricopeptide (TPR) repeat protein